MSTNFVYGSGNPLFQAPKKETKKETKKPTETKAQIDARIATSTQKLVEELKPLQEKYGIDPKTGGPVTTTTAGSSGSTTTTLTDEQIRENERAYQRQQDAAAEAEKKRRAGQSAYDILLAEFNHYGLGSFVDKNTVKVTDKDGKETGKLKILSLGKNVDIKHKWRTNVPNHWLWYTHLINDECKDLWIVKSVKDANVLHKHFNLCSISVQNESSQILLENNYDYLESIKKRKIVNFGTDFQGWHESYVITYLTDWSYFNVPNSTYDHFNVEDVSDYVKYFGVNSLRTLLKQKNYL
jgi:hypothetical protein